MRSCRERISDAVFSALKRVPSQYAKEYEPVLVKVERNRRDPVHEHELPSLILIDGDETARNDFNGEDGYDLSLAIQGAVIGAGEASAMRANALRAYVIEALVTDKTLGGLARDLNLTSAGDLFGCETAASETEGFMLGLTVTFATKLSDPFTFEYES